MNNNYMRSQIEELEHLVSGIKLILRTEYGQRHAAELFSVKSSLVAVHETLSDIVYNEDHPEGRKVRRFWKVSADGTSIEEVSEREYEALRAEENITKHYKNEDLEDPTTNDEF